MFSYKLRELHKTMKVNKHVNVINENDKLHNLMGNLQ